MTVTLLVSLCYVMSGIKSLETDFEKVNLLWCVHMNTDFMAEPYHGKCWKDYICKTATFRLPDVKPEEIKNGIRTISN